MVKHLVFFNLKTELSEAAKDLAKKEIVNALSELPKFIPQIKYYEIITNQSERSGGLDIGLISKFDSFEDLNIYRNHEKHIEAVEIIKKHKEFSTFIDYVEPKTIFQK